jgi:replicative DNA helicase
MEEKLIKDIIDEVEERDFYLKQHGDIYKAMSYLYYNQKSITYHNVIDRVGYKSGKDELTNYILNLTDTVASTVNFNNDIKTLIDLSQKRKLYELGKSFVEKDISGVTSESLLQKIEDTVDGIKTASNIETVNLKEYASQWLKDFESEHKPDTILFGFKELDKKIMFESGNLGIVGARPSVGKSALALNYAKNFCLQGKTVLYVTLEMTHKETMDRLIANLSKVEHDKIKRKLPLEEYEKTRIVQAKKDIEKLDFHIFYKGDMTPQHLINLSKKIKKDGGLDAVIVDYIQLMDSGKKNLSAVQDVTYISRKLKQLAQELDIQVLALSQLSRGSVKDGKKREPQLHDLRESGAIEQDADFVIMPHTDAEEGKFEQHKFISLYIRKNRSGTLGKVDYTYHGDYMEFEEKAWSVEEGKHVVVEQLDLENMGEEDNTDEDLPF